MLGMYQKLIKNGVLRQDINQLKIVRKLEAFQNEVHQKTSFNIFNSIMNDNCSFLTNFANTLNGRSKGLYMYGGVGTGKTYLLDLFVETYPNKNECLRAHWNSFLLSLEAEIFRVYKSNDLKTGKEKNLTTVKLITRKIVGKTKVICLDEVQFADPGSASLLSHLFDYLGKHNVKFVLTSNRHPSEIVIVDQNDTKNLTRLDKIFLEYCDVLKIESMTDYRKIEKSNLFKTEIMSDLAENYFDKMKTYCSKNSHDIFSKSIHTIIEKPLKNVGNSTEFYNHFNQLSEGGKKFKNFELVVCSGRKLSLENCNINCSGMFKNILMIDVEKLFFQNMCSSDYIAMCGYFSAIFIRDLPKLYPLIDGSSARKLINFVDIAYDVKTKIFILADEPFQSLLCMESNDNFNYNIHNHNMEAVKDEIFALKRTISRIFEMNSTYYLKIPHKFYKTDIFSDY